MTIGFFKSRRRSRPLGFAVKSGALALTLAFAGADGALAQTSSSTFVDVLINQNGAQQFFDVKGSNPTNAKPNSSQVNTPKNGIFPDGRVINNIALVKAQAFQAGGPLVGTSVSTFIDRPTGQGATSVIAQSVSVVQDRISISGVDPGDHQLVTLHKIMQLDGSEFASIQENLNGRHINTNISATLTITAGADGNAGSLFGSGPLGNNVFASVSLTSTGTKGSEVLNVLRAPQFLDFTFVTELNSDRAFSISMFEDALASADNIDGLDHEFASLDMFHTLRFTDGVSITDASGRVMCGLRITAASGLNFGAIDACAPTGGGGGGAGAVPEPASWALLIMGFGGLGSVLRRRRNLGAGLPGAFSALT